MRDLLDSRSSSLDLRLRAFALKSSREKNAYIMRTQCAQKRECDFFTRVTPTIYNFDPLKCLHFKVGTSLRRRPLLLQMRQNETSSNSKKLTRCARGTYDTRPRTRLISDLSVSVPLWLLLGSSLPAFLISPRARKCCNKRARNGSYLYEVTDVSQSKRHHRILI